MKKYYIGETSDAFEEPWGIFDLETGNVAYSEDGTALVFNSWSEARDYAAANDMRVLKTIVCEMKLFDEALKGLMDRFAETLGSLTLEDIGYYAMSNNQRKRNGLPMIRKQGLKRAWKNRRKE